LAAYKTEQRHLRFKGAEYHFVSYDGQPASKSAPASGPTWFLVMSGKRWAVMDQVAGEAVEEIDARLLEWLAQCDFTQASTASLR
jgi:hypothetical protein